MNGGYMKTFMQKPYETRLISAILAIIMVDDIYLCLYRYVLYWWFANKSD